MVRKDVIAIIGTVLVSATVILVLYVIANESIIYSQNFTRAFLSNSLQQVNTLDLKGDSYYIAGNTNHRIYFSDKNNFRKLLISNIYLSDTQRVVLNVDNQEHLKFGKAYIQIDSPFFYIKDGNMPGLFKGEVNTWLVTRFLSQSPYFTQAVGIPNSFVITTVASTKNGSTKQNILGKMSIDSPFVKWKVDVFENQIDGYYSTVGVLRYNRELNRLIYTYFLRNQYLVMDTNLNLLYRGNTIDSITQAQVRPLELKENIYTLASPPAIVNHDAQVYGQWLFVHSNLMGKNENRNVFDHSSTIDVYDLIKGQYKFSFYLPEYNGKKVESFKVFKNWLVAVHGRYVISYDLKFLTSEYSRAPYLQY